MEKERGRAKEKKGRLTGRRTGGGLREDKEKGMQTETNERVGIGTEKNDKDILEGRTERWSRKGGGHRKVKENLP